MNPSPSIFTHLRMIFLCLLCLIHGTFSATFVEIQNHLTPIFDTPSPNAQPIALGWRKSLLEIINQTPAYYQIKLYATPSSSGWIPKENLLTIENPSQSESSRIGMLTRITQTETKVPSASMITQPKKATRNIEAEYTFLPDKRESFMYPRYKGAKYPIIDVDGFVEASYQQRDQFPSLANITPSDNRWQSIQKDPLYNQLPKDIAAGQSKLETRLKFDVEGKFSKDLAVQMHIEQEPDFPGIYDVKVQHKDTRLTFWHYDIGFNTGPFLNTQKALNGFMYQRERENENIIFAIGKERSKAKKYEAFGTGRHIVNLGNRSILNNSVKVWINNNPKKQGVDYTINYYSGEITFKPHAIPSSIDFVEVVYEFTNPIEDFLPSMSQKDFLGATYKWRPNTGPKLDRIVLKRTETILVSSQNIDTLNQTYKLQQTNLLLGSETLHLNETELHINDDYTLKSNKGNLRILADILKENDKIQITYEFYETATKTQIIIGKDTTGPYLLAHSNIVPDSFEIRDRNYILAKAKDYTLTPLTGELIFKYPIKHPKLLEVSYSYFKVIQQPITKKTAPFFFEAAYLRESSKPREENLEIDLTATENTTLSAGSNSFKTQINPLSSKDYIKITLNSIPLDTSFFNISNAYTGEITISPNQLLAGQTHQVGIRYRYQKPFSTRFTFYGISGWLNTPYVNNDQFNLVHPTVKQNGITKILYWTGSTEITLLPNRDYLVNYGETGQDIQIRFLTQNDKALFPESENSVLLDYPGPENRITLIYQYIPNTEDSAGGLLKETIAISVGGKIRNNWFYDVDVAIANNNFSKPQLDDQLIVSGNGIENHAYGLGHPSLVKDSESVLLNGIRLTKDKDYFINYTNGTLRFVNITPSTQDLINITFQYIDTSNKIVSGESNNYSYATQFNTRYQMKNLEINSHIKWIDKNFNPLAPIKDKKGSMYYGTLLNWAVNPVDKINVGYEHVDSLTGKAFEEKDLYLRSHEFKGLWEVNSIPYINTSHQARYYFLVEDPTDTPSNNHAIDQKHMSYQGNLSFGPTYFRNTLNQNFTNQTNDYLDASNQSETNVYATAYTSNLILKNIFLIGNTSFKPSYESTTKETRAYTEQKEIKSRANEDRQKYGIIWNFEPFRTFKNQINISQTQINTQAALNATPNKSTLHNRLFTTSFSPYSWVAAQYSYNNIESESIAIGQQGEQSNKSHFAVSKFSPFGLGRYFKVSRDHLLMIPVKNSNIHYNFTHFESFKDNNRKKANSRAQTIGITALNPIPGLTVKTLQFDQSNATNIIDVATATTSSNTSQSNRNSWSADTSFTPPLPLLNMFSYTYSLKEVSDTRDSSIIALSNTTNITQENRPEHTYIHKVSFNPGLLHILNIPLLTLSTSLSEENTQKTHKKTTKLINNITQITSENIKQDNSFLLKQGLSGVISPFNLLPFNGQYTSHKERLSRNILSANTGLTLKHNTHYTIGTAITPISFITLNGSYSIGNNQQHRSPSLNASQETLIKATDEENPNLLTDFIQETNTTKMIGASFKMFSFLALQGSATDRTVDSEKLFFNTSLTSVSDNRIIKQQIGSVGATLTPFSGLKAIYNYSLAFSQTDGGTQQKGYTGDAQIEFTPLQIKGFNVKFLYSRQDNWGFNLNTLEKTEIESGTGDNLQSKIVERDDTVETGSISINIEMQNVFHTPYDEKLVITAEGFIKKITNGLDSQRKTEGLPELSYEITGVTLKGTIHF